MVSFSNVFLAMNKNFRQWKHSPRIYVILAILFVFHWYSFRGYAVIADYLGVSMSLSVFPLFVALPLMVYVFGAIPMLLYGEAPFSDHHTPFVVIRTGKTNWIIGQILYIFLSSFIYTFVSVCMSVIVMLPNVHFELDWGQALRTMAVNPELAQEVGVNSIMPGDDLFNAMSGQKGMLYSILLYWLVTVFLGMVILLFNLLFQKGIGLAVAGFFIGLSYFSAIFGGVAFGNIVKWVSPVCWRSLAFLALTPDSNLPPIWYAFTVLIVSILVMSVVSVIVFCKKDLEFEKGEY